LSGCTTSHVSQNSHWDIDNPYANVDWSRYLKVKANFHTHTTRAGGRLSPAEAVKEYDRLGYGVLSITDHGSVTWPWDSYMHNPEQLGMVAVQGSELSSSHDLGVYFSDVSGKSTLSDTLAGVRSQNGLGVMFHPGRYNWSTQQYVDLYSEWHELVGMEVFNQGDRYRGDRKTWDALLSVLMPQGRPVWGFSNDDMHKPGHVGRNWNVLLLPELSAETVRTAIEQGAFFFVYAPKGHKGAMPPVVKAIEVDAQKGIIRITATDYARIEWISAGRIVHRGEMMDLAEKSNVHGYVRIVLHAKDGGSLIGTQPMRIQPR